MNKLVSIVLPVYNGERYLQESIESVIAQTYENWELLILDDCSTDKTADIAKKFAEIDSRILYFKNETNLRLPGNLNRGFSLSNGDYLTWTSDDNRFHPTAIERMVFELENAANVDFVYASYNVIDDRGDYVDYYVVPKDCTDNIVGIDCIGACFMYSRAVYEAIGEYDVDLFLVEDFDYWQRTFAKFHAKSISDVMYDYRKHGNNLTSTMKKEVFYTAYERMVRKNIQLYNKLNFKKKYYFYYAINVCKQGLNSKMEKEERAKYLIYKTLYYVCCEIPNKVKNRITRVLLKRKTV